MPFQSKSSSKSLSSLVRIFLSFFGGGLAAWAVSFLASSYFLGSPTVYLLALAASDDGFFTSSAGFLSGIELEMPVFDRNVGG